MNRLVFLSQKKRQRRDIQIQIKETKDQLEQIMTEFHAIQDIAEKMQFSISVLQEQKLMDVQALTSIFCSIQSSVNILYSKELSELILDQLMYLDDTILNCRQQDLNTQNQYNRLLNKDAAVLKTMKECVSLEGIQFQCIIQPEYFQTLYYIIVNNDISSFGQFSEQYYQYLYRDMIKGPGMKIQFIQIFNEMSVYICPQNDEQLALTLQMLCYDGLCYNGNACIRQFFLIQLLYCSNMTLAQYYALFENVFLYNIGTSITYCVQFMRRAYSLNNDYMPVQRFFERFTTFQSIKRSDAICLWKFIVETSESVMDNRLAQLLIAAVDRLNDAHPDQQSYQQASTKLNDIIYNT